MHTQPLTPSVIGATINPTIRPIADQFSLLTGHAGLVASEFSYRKDEEIYGEDEPADYVYQVIQGAVRTYKLLSDGRRQIGAFPPAKRRLRTQNPEPTTGWRRKPSSIPQCAWSNAAVSSRQRGPMSRLRKNSGP